MCLFAHTYKSISLQQKAEIWTFLFPLSSPSPTPRRRWLSSPTVARSSVKTRALTIVSSTAGNASCRGAWITLCPTTSSPRWRMMSPSPPVCSSTPRSAMARACSTTPTVAPPKYNRQNERCTFCKTKGTQKINYIATEADIKSVSASVTYTCLLSMFFRVQTLFKH